MKNKLKNYSWINKPRDFFIGDDFVKIKTDPNTDFWQRTYYGFRNDNGHILAFNTSEQEFSYSVSTSFIPAKLFDQCGVVIYLDQDNWFKASIEFHNESFSRLGSVVTNFGYSDWATKDIKTGKRIKKYYRLNRRNNDFLIEESNDGKSFLQMRIFHMHNIKKEIRIGVYACSPLKSTIQAEFMDFQFGQCVWELHKNP
jgi:regulation of enolase protein 1 (concanavalin A-like superfamily)